MNLLLISNSTNFGETRDVHGEQDKRADCRGISEHSRHADIPYQQSDREIGNEPESYRDKLLYCVRFAEGCADGQPDSREKKRYCFKLKIILARNYDVEHHIEPFKGDISEKDEYQILTRLFFAGYDKGGADELKNAYEHHDRNLPELRLFFILF